MDGLKRFAGYAGGGWIIGLTLATLAEVNFPSLPAWFRPAICILFACVGLRLAVRLAGARDTVIYFLRNGNRIVYVGVAYQHRAENRVAEHRRSGKNFNRVDWSRPMPRTLALAKEKRMISRLKPRYNIAHC